MSHYQNLWGVYKQATTWTEFIKLVSKGPGKWTLLQALEGGWQNRIRADLCDQFAVPVAEANVLLNRYQSLVSIHPKCPSVQEVTLQLSTTIRIASTLRGYFRYAYYVAIDDPDIIFTILDEQLSQLGAGTPTRDVCARSYTAITGRPINPEVVVLSAGAADKLANHLAVELEDIQKRITTVTETAPDTAKRLVEELNNVNKLHVTLTGKSLVTETVDELQEMLTQRQKLKDLNE